MAFTLAFHIVLVPLGVAWGFMTLIANYRAVKHDDADALLLAQRWSKYMAVTFAVGAVTVVAANAWMNEPSGFTLNSAGQVVDVDPWSVIFNKAMPLQSLHMLVAAYLVGGFLIASVYAFAMLRGRRDRYHRLGFVIP